MIVPAVPAVAAALAQVHATAFDSPWDEATIAALLATPGVLGFVVGAAPDVVGFILVRLAADEAEVLTMATTPAQRRRGNALGLLKAAMRVAQERGAKSLFLEVATDNFAAGALYRKAGFVPVGTRRGYYPRRADAVDALIMRCDLKQ